MIQLDRTHNHNKEGFWSSTDGLFFYSWFWNENDIKISISWFNKELKIIKVLWKTMCLSKKWKEIYYHHRFLDFLSDWYHAVFT